MTKVITDEGESNSLLFRALGGFVNVGPGGFGGGEMFPRGGGDSFGKGMNAAPCKTSMKRDQRSQYCTGRSHHPWVRVGLLGVVTPFRARPPYKEGGIGFNLDPSLHGGGVLSPLSFQPGEIGRGFITSVSMTGISLKGMPMERPRVGGRPLKTYLLLKFEGPALSTIVCGGVIGDGGRCCAPEAEECNYTSHQTKAWEASPREPGMYILDGSALKAFLETCLPMRDATRSVTGRADLEDGEQTMEAWTAIFRHLQEVGTRGNEEGREDPGLRCFATAMKTPRGQVNTDLLNSPKQLCMTKEGLLGTLERLTSSSRIRWPLPRGSSGCRTETPRM